MLVINADYIFKMPPYQYLDAYLIRYLTSQSSQVGGDYDDKIQKVLLLSHYLDKTWEPLLKVSLEKSRQNIREDRYCKQREGNQGRIKKRNAKI